MALKAASPSKSIFQKRDQPPVFDPWPKYQPFPEHVAHAAACRCAGAKSSRISTSGSAISTLRLGCISCEIVVALGEEQHMVVILPFFGLFHGAGQVV